MATPSYVLNIAEEFERQKLDPRNCSLSVGILGAEPWTNTLRSQIETRLRLDAVDIYGLSEVMGPGVAQECIESKDGPVVWEDHFYPEIIDSATGKLLRDGQHGELVFTSLTKEALPVIRYRTGDLTRLLPPTARSMRRIERITGRSDDMLIIRGVNVFPTQIEELILKQPELAPHYELEVFRDGHLDSLVVRVEIAPGYDGDGAVRAAAAGALVYSVKGYVGISVRVEVCDPNQIPRSVAKAQRVIDRRKTLER